MIRRSVKLQLAAFALITMVGVSYVGARYVGLLDKLIGGQYVVTADLASSGGIFEHAQVTYRGVVVGKVERLRLAADGVHADLRLDASPRIPADTLAVVADRSAIGEQYLDLQPRTDGGPYLHDGSRIGVQNTRTPLPTSTLLVDLDRLVGSVDQTSLTTVIDELGTALQGTGPALGRLIDDGDQLTRAATDALPETVRLLQDGNTVLATQQRSGSAIRGFSKDLADLADTLRASDGSLRRVVDGGVPAVTEVKALVDGASPAVTTLLGNLLTVNQITATRVPGLRQLLVTYPVVVAGGYTVVPGDGTAHFGLVLNVNDPPVCTAGYEGTHRRSPQETSDVPANTAARCTAPPPGSQVRGAGNAPRPAGADQAAPVRALGATPSPTVTPTVTPTSAPASPPGAEAVTFGPPASLGPTYVAGADPVTGLALGPDGSPLAIGTRGGQYAAMGEDSWQWLLLGPLGS
ncbi:MAG: MCE family protein [Motilibacteraceae bacterium]